MTRAGARPASSRVFVARLVDTTVFDPIGDPVGKVHDVIVLIRMRGDPRAVGFVIDVSGRRRVFLPLSRVTVINPGQVIITGLVNIRRFEQRKAETLVVGELLDRVVALRDGSGRVTIRDVAIEPDMLTGELAPDSGSVHISKNTSVGYLRQINDIDSDLSIEEELLTVIKPITDMENTLKGMHKAMKGLSGEELESLYDSYTRLVHEYELADGYAAKSRVTGILKGLGFSEDEFSRKINMLSGGQKTRVFLGKLLLSKPNIIMLDEPTNHLDLSSIEWLENYLLNYKGTVIIVSHDRYFLDRIVNKVIDLEACEALVYSGNYTEFTQKKALLKEAALKADRGRKSVV